MLNKYLSLLIIHFPFLFPLKMSSLILTFLIKSTLRLKKKFFPSSTFSSTVTSIWLWSQQLELRIVSFVSGVYSQLWEFAWYISIQMHPKECLLFARRDTVLVIFTSNCLSWYLLHSNLFFMKKQTSERINEWMKSEIKGCTNSNRVRKKMVIGQRQLSIVWRSDSHNISWA